MVRLLPAKVQDEIRSFIYTGAGPGRLPSGLHADTRSSRLPTILIQGPEHGGQLKEREGVPQRVRQTEEAAAYAPHAGH